MISQLHPLSDDTMQRFPDLISTHEKEAKKLDSNTMTQENIKARKRLFSKYEKLNEIDRLIGKLSKD